MQLSDAKTKIDSTVIPDGIFMGETIRIRLGELSEEIDCIIPIIGDIEIPDDFDAADAAYEQIDQEFGDHEIAVADIFMETFSIIQKLTTQA